MFFLNSSFFISLILHSFHQEREALQAASVMPGKDKNALVRARQGGHHRALERLAIRHDSLPRFP